MLQTNHNGLSYSIDLIAVGSGPFNVAQFNDVAYLRIGFDGYQFIGEKALVTITGLKEVPFPR